MILDIVSSMESIPRFIAFKITGIYYVIYVAVLVLFIFATIGYLGEKKEKNKGV